MAQWTDTLWPRTDTDALTQSIPLHQLQCYSLPFGALGFTSHVLTYYTIACLWFGRKPLWPFHKIHNTKLDLVLGGVSVLVCIVMSVVTMVKCRSTWQLLVIAVWKMSMSLLNGLTALHVAVLVVRKGEEEEEVRYRTAAWWVMLYIPGMIAGMSGLMSLVSKVASRIPELLGLTLAFYGIIGASLVVGLLSMGLICYWGGGAPEKVALTGFVVTLVLFIVLGAFYSDWALGIMLDNLIGIPSSDASGVYWTYFVAKRLTLFSL